VIDVEVTIGVVVAAVAHDVFVHLSSPSAQVLPRIQSKDMRLLRLKRLPRLRYMPTSHSTVIGLSRERFVALGLPSWTHLRTRTRYWGVFTLQGIRKFASCAWPTPYGIAKAGEYVKGKRLKLIPRQKGAFRRCSWNHRDVVLFTVVRTITASRENRRELMW